MKKFQRMKQTLWINVAKIGLRGGLAGLMLSAGVLMPLAEAVGQQAIVPTGGDARLVGTGQGPTVSYSVGQVSAGYSGNSGFQFNAGVQQPVEWLNAGAVVNGQLRYLNSVATPMTNSQIRLMQGSQMLHNVPTGSAGTFTIPAVASGAYSVVMSTSKPWGGVNATDALLISRHFTVVSPLSGLALLAADVNASGLVNSSDALLVGRRSTQVLNSFAAGDWMWTPTAAQIGSLGATLDVRTLCVGDVNGSYVPNTNQRMEMQSIVTRGELEMPMVATLSPVEVFLAGEEVEMGALTLELELPRGLELHGVEMASGDAGGELIYNRVGDRLLVAWYSVEGWQRKGGDALLRLFVRGRDLGEWKWGGISELADRQGDVIPQWGLTMPRLVWPRPQGAEFSANVYPNPARGMRTLSYELPSAGEVSLQLTDAAGRVVWQQAYGYERAGLYEEPLNLASMAAGSYRLEVKFRSGQEMTSRVLHLVEYR
jgi:hypothetical protein